MITRTLTNRGDPLVDGAGQPLAGISISFDLVSKGGRATAAWDEISGERIAAGVVTTTDVNGEFAVALWPTSRSAVPLCWRCHVDCKGVLDIIAPLPDAPGPLQWIDWKNAQQIVTLPDYAQQALDTHTSDASLHFRWRGAWVEATPYQAYDAVSYGGSSWKAQQDSTGQPPAEDAYWTLLAQRGDQGEAGPTGPQGLPPTIPAQYARDMAWAIKGRSVAADRQTLLSPSGLIVNIGSVTCPLAAQIEIDLSAAGNWDSVTTDYTVAANRAGRDFYIYACQPAFGTAPIFVVSANSTVPVGYTVDTSRKIGGFHCLCVATAAIASHPLTGFLAGDILPETVWDLLFRPTCSAEGMAYDAKSGIWVDIYLTSGTGATTASVYGATISDTRTWMDFVDDLGTMGKRLLTDTEFQLAAAGSNEETNISGSADPVTTGGHIATSGRRMIANIGLEDACGVMWQWLQDQSYRYDPDGSVQAASKTFTVTYTAAPGGNPVYLRQAADGSYYLASNMATALTDKHIGHTDYKVPIKHDVAAATGAVGQIYYNSGGTSPAKMLCNITSITKDVYLPTNNPAYSLQLKHDANAAANGRPLYYDDGVDNRLECNLASAANDLADLAMLGGWGYYDLGNKGSLYRQGSNGDVKLAAGGPWTNGATCGSRSRSANSSRWHTASTVGARGCARSL